jgi:glycosyltransferase involved in cell wall biosynthesis
MNSSATTGVPMVSVAMVTYNHEKYIAQAIESVLMQETTFPIELIIGEDCSTDGTRAIVKRYADARPDVIRVLFRERNLGAGENILEVVSLCRGKYINVIEGDDYWTDKSKLQQQFDFLENHPDCVLCFHDSNVEKLDSNNGLVSKTPFYSTPPKSRLGFKDFVTGFYPHTAACLFLNDRTSLLPVLERKLKCYALTLYYSVLAKGGLAGYIPDIMSVYRLHAGGAFSSASSVRQIQMDNDGLWPARQYFSVPEQRRLFDTRLAGNYTTLCIIHLRQKHIWSFIKSYCCVLWLLCFPLNMTGILEFLVRQLRFAAKVIWS